MSDIERRAGTEKEMEERNRGEKNEHTKKTKQAGTQKKTDGRGISDALAFAGYSDICRNRDLA